MAPETALLEPIWENKINAAYSVRSLRDLQNEFPNLNILIGATTYKMFNHAEKITNTARKMRNQNVFYDVYNSAIFIPSVAIYKFIIKKISAWSRENAIPKCFRSFS